MRRLAICALLLSASSQPALANDDGVAFDERGITLDTGDLELNLGGRLHIDGVVFDDPATGRKSETDLELRRARLELSGKVGSVFQFRIDREFTGDGKGWRNMWASVRPINAIEVKGGNFNVPFSMEVLQSSNTMPFAERSLASALAPNYGLGGAISASGKRWSVAAGYFGKALENEAGYAAQRGHGVVARATGLPVRSGGGLVHVGLAFERRSFDADKEVRFSAGPGSNFAPTLMSSRGINDPHRLTSWNGELGGTLGPVLVQAQYIATKVSRQTRDDVSFAGQTLQASWMVTGERYSYSQRSGVLGGPKLKGRNLALELAARYSRLDLDDAQLKRGVGRAISVSANLYLARNMRLMATYTDSHVNAPLWGVDVNNRVGVTRFQVNF